MVQLTLFAVGKLKKNLTSQLFEHYHNKICSIASNVGITKVVLKEINESIKQTTLLRQIEEGKKLLELVNNDTILIICDELGDNLSSRNFAKKFQKEIDSHKKHIIFAIGGADGFSAEIKEKANYSISFGKFTWPHQLTRIMLAEQLYRAITIMLNHPYHRD